MTRSPIGSMCAEPLPSPRETPNLLHSESKEEQMESARDLTDILARLEAATGPDQELDKLIGAALGSNPHITGPVSAAGVGITRYDHITASLDAALALVERVLPGWAWAIFGPDPSFGLPMCEASLAPGDAFSGVKVDGPTPALALLIAMTRALISTPDTSERTGGEG